MANKVLNYHAQPYGEYQLGFCVVDMGGKCNIILKVLKSKQGNIYCTFNSVRIDDSWLCDFSFKDKDYERAFLTECLEQVKPMMSVAQTSQAEPRSHQTAPPMESNQQGLPF